MRTLIVGDTHADARFVANVHRLARTTEATEHPVRVIIQLGDFGYTFDTNMMASISAWLDRCEETKWFWIDGNHDNHDYLDNLRSESDITRPISMGEFHERLFYVPRGAVFAVGQTTFLGLGGGYSIDKRRRKAHVSWWPQEMPTQGDVYRAIANAEKLGPIDVMLTHDAPVSDYLETWLDRFRFKVDKDSYNSRELISAAALAIRPKKLYHGHHHVEYTTNWEGIEIQGVGANVVHKLGGQHHSDEVRVGDNVFMEDF